MTPSWKFFPNELDSGSKFSNVMHGKLIKQDFVLMIMIIMMMMINCFCGMVDQRKAFSLISSPDHCQRSSPSRISNPPQAGFELAQNLSSGLVEWSCAVAITATPRRHTSSIYHHTRLIMLSPFYSFDNPC